MKIILNINTEVTVTLTQAGADHYNKKMGKYYKCEHFPTESYSFPLWELMHIFGELMYMGNMRLPFENNEIIIKRAD